MSKLLINSRFTAVAAGLVLLAACSNAPFQTQVVDSSAANAVENHSTILLVSLEDGSIVRQTVNLDADICMKSLGSTETNCLTQGDPVVNDAGIVVGYEMLPETIQLQGVSESSVVNPPQAQATAAR